MVTVGFKRDLKMKIGVLALQGAFVEHVQILENLGVEPVQVRLPNHLKALDALIIPGGESTSIAKLAVSAKLMEPLRHFALQNPVWGICAGMIFMAVNVDTGQPNLGLMDIDVKRNAFGRQINSFVTDIMVPELPSGDKKPFSAVFIRAPQLVRAGANVRVIARLPDGEPVAAVQGKWLVTSFHPELTPDTRFHQFFLEMAQS